MSPRASNKYLRGIEVLAYILAAFSFFLLFFESIFRQLAAYPLLETFTALANLSVLGLSIMLRLFLKPVGKVKNILLLDILLLMMGMVLLFYQPKFLIFFLLIRQSYFTLEYLLFRAFEGKLYQILTDNPPVSLILSFAFVVLVGSVLLMLPSAAVSGQVTPPTDALFIATSATCVTGLSVYDIGTYFTRFGQIVILILMQVGGLGIMTISTAFALILGRRLTLKLENVMYSVMGKDRRLDLFQLLKSVVLVTVTIELVGALLLFFVFSQTMGSAKAIFHAVFHSVSAFCNAGFSLFSDSLIHYVDQPLLNIVITALIILGGIGFAVIVDLYHLFLHRRKHRLSLHSKIVLSTTLGLLLLGFIGFFVAEYHNTMQGFPLSRRLMSSWFQSTSCRTAGFDTVAFDHISPATVLVCQALMFVGASPGSTGGGMKTTTLALLLLSVIALLRGRRELSVFKRKIPMSNFREAVALVSLITVILLFSTFLLLLVENKSFDKVAFEAISAFSTCGLSMGITPYLSLVGKYIIIILMYIGRIGPLTIVYALSTRQPQAKISFAEEKIAIG